MSERFDELADFGLGIVFREISESSRWCAPGKGGATSVEAIPLSAFVDLAFQSVLGLEEGLGGRAEEERF